MSIVSAKPPFTDKQGQYLAFIHTYVLLHRRPPAEADMERYFGVTPPSVHRMVVELERRGLIKVAPDPDDRRSKSLKLTAKGMSLLVDAAEVWERVHEEVEELIPDGDPNALRKNLRALS